MLLGGAMAGRGKEEKKRVGGGLSTTPSHTGLPIVDI